MSVSKEDLFRAPQARYDRDGRTIFGGPGRPAPDLDSIPPRSEPGVVRVTVTDPRREFPWLVSGVMTVLRGEDAKVRMPALRLLDPESGSIPLEGDDLEQVRRVAGLVRDWCRAEVGVSVSIDG